MNTLIICIFILGYTAIAFENSIKINKTAAALLTGVLCWTAYILLSTDKQLIAAQLNERLGELSGILFFLMGAMIIVELIDAHDGFDIITSRITTVNKRRLLWIICLLTFFLSAVLDNLTTAIIIVSLLRKLIDNRDDRIYFTGMVIIAANAGGAWSPIGDVTTTMLWIGGQISPVNIMLKLFIPSLACLIVPLLIVSIKLKGNISSPVLNPLETKKNGATEGEKKIIFFTGLGGLIFVPVFKTITHLPPFMGVLLALGILWVVSELLHSGKEKKDKDALSAINALRRIDVQSILFFLGILTAISALQSAGLLTELALLMNQKIGNLNIIVPAIGLLSAVVDNVPLIAASTGMYDLHTYPQDSYIWEFLAYCAGTGGSILIIGSAAGVAAMGMEKIDFIWYLKKIGWLAVLGFIAGSLCYIVLEHLLYSGHN